MDPASMLLILGLIERAFVLAPQIVDLIRRLKAGEKITPEEVARVEALVNLSVKKWKNAGETPEKD